jgi:hypothetical protein
MTARSQQRAQQRSKALADLVHLVKEICAEVFTLIVIALPLLVRLVCVGVAVFGAAWSFIPVWSAFGGDPIALLPAAALVLTPLAFVLSGGLSWGGLLLAGLMLFAAGGLVPLVSPLVLDLVCVGIIGAVCFQTLKNNPERNESR